MSEKVSKGITLAHAFHDYVRRHPRMPLKVRAKLEEMVRCLTDDGLTISSLNALRSVLNLATIPGEEFDPDGCNCEDCESREGKEV